MLSKFNAAKKRVSVHFNYFKMLTKLLKFVLWALTILLLQSQNLYTNGEEQEEGLVRNLRQNGQAWLSLQDQISNLMKQSAASNYLNRGSFGLFNIFRDQYQLPNGLKAPLLEYDYIIVGAGAAGCVLASRLSENPNITVLLLETGKPENVFTEVPLLAPYLQRTDYTMPYFMEHQPGVCMGMINERCYWPRGRAVGGTSVINYMIHTRGRPIEWDRIAAAGNDGWSYKEVLEYYKKSENANLKGFENSPYRGRGGELNVEFPPFRTLLIDTFLEAGRILGHPTVDYNSPEQLGFGYVQATVSYGRRMSAAKAFLHRNKQRPNLHIMPETTVTKVLIKDKTAYGVEYVRRSLKSKVLARREVILSAGPIASPQLLMLSGVGPREHLTALGIQVVKDLPVGRTLYDHITFPGLIFTLNVTGASLHENVALKFESIRDWLLYGDGMPSSPGGVEGIGYIKTHVSDDPDEVPDIELISIGGSILADGGPGGSKSTRRGMMISEQVSEGAFGSIDNADTWSAFPMLLHPKSVGYLELKDKNPFSHPRLYGNYLTDPRDVATFIASIRYIQKLANTKPFQRLGARVHPAQYPACHAMRFDSDDYWECAVRTLTATLHHQIATCRMGPASDPKAVVDPQLRVHGVRNLRVADSSIIPNTLSLHTNAPAIMIGEKAADIIKATW